MSALRSQSIKKQLLGTAPVKLMIFKLMGLLLLLSNNHQSSHLKKNITSNQPGSQANIKWFNLKISVQEKYLVNQPEFIKQTK
jgi:hypothetical protein